MTAHVYDPNFLGWTNTSRNAALGALFLTAAIALPFAIMFALL